MGREGAGEELAWGVVRSEIAYVPRFLFLHNKGSCELCKDLVWKSKSRTRCRDLQGGLEPCEGTYSCLAHSQQIPLASRRDGESRPHWGVKASVRVLWAWRAGLAVSLTPLGFPIPTPSVAWWPSHSQHPEAGEWAAWERPQGVSPA